MNKKELKKEARKALNKELDKLETKKGTVDGFFAIENFLNDWIDKAYKAGELAERDIKLKR